MASPIDQHNDVSLSFKTVQLLKEQTLGIGSYGKVCKAKCDDLLCAAKLIHETLIDPTAQRLIAPQREHRLPMKRFVQECEFLSTIRHPNIVQYLGLYRDPDTGLPALLMELMDSSLTHFLESSTQPIPYHVQVNICHDITLALSFLHSNNIVHRDLSGNNVLLIGNVRAKVTDFGMARLGDENPRVTHLTFTMCPGTDVYMPPEAVQDEPVYTEKIDCFSFGVITIQILTRQFPKPGNRRKRIEISHPGLPSGTMADVLIGETERRQSHISQIDPNHTLLEVSLDCLKDRDVERPSAQQLCERVAALKEIPEYSESVRAAVEERSTLEHDEREREIRSLRQQLQDLELGLREKDETISAGEQQISQQIEEIDRLEREKEEITEGNWRQLGQLQDESQQLKRKLIKVKKQLQEKEEEITRCQRLIAEVEQRSQQRSGRIEITWRAGVSAPRRMSGHWNCAVADSTTVYLQRGTLKILAFNFNTSTWSYLPNTPTDCCPIVIVNNLLTVVGGSYGPSTITNQLLSFTEKDKEMKWTEEFPPMPTKRKYSKALCTGTALIVAGGLDEELVELRTVEVMNTETLQWSTAAADLPEPMICTAGAVCGDHVYILYIKYRWQRSMYTCPVSTLIQSDESRPTADVWKKVTEPPVYESDFVSILGRLLTIGGKDYLTSAVHMYRPTTDSWEVISHIATPKRQIFAAALPNNQIIVVGGRPQHQHEIDSVEIGTVEYVDY